MQRRTDDVISVRWMTMLPHEACEMIPGARSRSLARLAWIFFVEFYTPYRLK